MGQRVGMDVERPLQGEEMWWTTGTMSGRPDLRCRQEDQIALELHSPVLGDQPPLRMPRKGRYEGRPATLAVGDGPEHGRHLGAREEL
jgi:hypothetical protein